MKRVLTMTLLALALLALAAVCTVLLRADGSGLPAPDPSLPILLADGTRRPLAEVLDLARSGQPLPVPQPLVTVFIEPAGSAEDAAVDPAELNRVREDLARSLRESILAREGPIFRLAETARHEGRLEEAAALYLSIPEDDRRYGRAQRRLAWDVLTKGQGQPRRAVAYAHAALAAEPFDANSWQDLARVYGATLGLDVDEWD